MVASPALPEAGMMEPLETLPEGTIKRIHINRANLIHNQKTGESRPVYSIKHKGRTHVAHAINVQGPSWFPNPSITKPLACGARVWMWTRARVDLWGERVNAPQ